MSKAFTKIRVINAGCLVPTSDTFEDSLKSGVYELKMSNVGMYFVPSPFNTDGLVHLPGTAYDQVVAEMETFLKPETKNKFDAFKFLYKRSFLLYGRPGGGKTCIVNRVIQLVLAQGGIVLKGADPTLLHAGCMAVNDLNPNQLILVVLEEMDETIKSYEKSLLTFLDGQDQAQNMVIMATTNYIDKIPARFMRPGRLSSMIEVLWPSAAARRAYLATKFTNTATVDEWTTATDGLSIDEIKEVVLATECLGQERVAVIKKLRTVKESTSDYDVTATKDKRHSEMLDWNTGPESNIVNFLKSAVERAGINE